MVVAELYVAAAEPVWWPPVVEGKLGDPVVPWIPHVAAYRELMRASAAGARGLIAKRTFERALRYLIFS